MLNEANMGFGPYIFTEIEARAPKHLSKMFEISQEGALKSRGGGKLFEARARVCHVASPSAFLEKLTKSGSNVCFMYGIPTPEYYKDVTSFELWQSTKIDERLQKGLVLMTEKQEPILSRTRSNFVWPKGSGGIFMLDYDPTPDQPLLSPQDVLARIFKVAPAMRYAPHIIQPSNSSYLYDTRTNTELKGMRGSHIYFFVQDAEFIPQAGQNLFDRLWLSGEGRFVLSGSGSFLPRTLVDKSVWQPERLDFCGAPHCMAPVERRAPSPKLENPYSAPARLSECLPNLSQKELDELRRMQITEKIRRRPESEKVRSRWVDARTKDAVANQVKSPEGPSAGIAAATFRVAAERGLLYADFPIILSNGEKVTVGQLLADKPKYDKKTCRDPLEPDYRDGAVTGWLNLSAPEPYIRSHAHGGSRYVLSKDRAPVLDDRCPANENSGAVSGVSTAAGSEQILAGARTMDTAPVSSSKPREDLFRI